MKNRKTRCKWCNRNITTTLLEHHEVRCPLSSENLRIVLNWIREYIEHSSNLNRIRIYPKAVRYNEFARRRGLLSYNSLRRVFRKTEWKSIIESMIWIAIANEYVSDDDFPPFMRQLFHSTQFVEPSAYRNALAKIEEDEQKLLDTKRKRVKNARKSNKSIHSNRRHIHAA